MTGPTPVDEFDRAALNTRDRAALVDVSRRFLERRLDAALGLAPARFLDAVRGDLWLLYWCAARRVDDSVEDGRESVAEWRRRLRGPLDGSLAERCVAELLRAREFEAFPVGDWLDRSLRGIEGESVFTSPKPWSEYHALLRLKSVPSMRVFDALLAPNEDPEAREAHAEAFAISAQLGDDCRDVRADLARGRCFVTKEETEGHPDLASLVRSAAFATRRQEMCRGFLHAAEGAASRFRSQDARRGAQRLAGFWKDAIDSGQVRPTESHLAVPEPSTNP